MKYFLIIFIVSKASSIPISNDRIVYPDELSSNIIDNRVDDTEFDQSSLLNNPNILISENATKLLANQQSKGAKNAEDGDFFQGDIVLLDKQLSSLNDSSDSSARTGLKNIFQQWPKYNNGKVIVPFIISDDFSQDDKLSILTAMYDLSTYTCVEFKPRTFENDFIYIISGKGCYSNFGKVGGLQYLSLQHDDCIAHGHILHELIHALGFHHMHNHVDRDKYVRINWNNIKTDMYSNFYPVSPVHCDNFGTPYDYYSVMHYRPNEFSQNGFDTISPVDYRFRHVIGQRVGLSLGDVNRINAMYKCNEGFV